MMAPQLHVSTYSEQFGSAGKGRPAQLRPTSSHRRNNPHPRPDFLLPRRIQSSYRPTRSALRSYEGDDGGPLFPPVRQLTFHNPEIKPNNHTFEGPLQPIIKPLIAPALPSADQPRELQLAKPPAASIGQLQTIHSSSHRPLHLQQPGYLRNSCSAQGFRTIATNTGTRSPTGNPLSPQQQYQRSRSNSSLQESCGYSCFQVVKPFQSGHYIIHPQFVSESLRFTAAG